MGRDPDAINEDKTRWIYLTEEKSKANKEKKKEFQELVQESIDDDGEYLIFTLQDDTLVVASNEWYEGGKKGMSHSRHRTSVSEFSELKTEEFSTADYPFEREAGNLEDLARDAFASGGKVNRATIEKILGKPALTSPPQGSESGPAQLLYVPKSEKIDAGHTEPGELLEKLAKEGKRGSLTVHTEDNALIGIMKAHITGLAKGTKKDAEIYTEFFWDKSKIAI